MAVKRLEALELGELLGSLMGSVVDAQARSARTTVEFIDTVGFEKSDGETRMRTVRMRYRKRDENGEPQDFEIEVPLLALVNVPSLAVSEAKLAFSYDVVTAHTGSTSDDQEGDGPSSGSVLKQRFKALRPAKLRGFVRRTPTKTTNNSSNHAERSTTSIDLDVTLAQQEVPIGVERLFDLAELGITEEPAKD